MSESTIPFQQGQTAVMDRPVTDFDPVEEPGSGSNRTKLLAVGGLAAVLVLGLVAYFLLFAGGGGEPEAAPAPKPPVAAPEAAPAAEPVSQPKINAKNFGRDPFKPLVVEPVAAVDPGPTGSTGDPATGGTTDPGTTGTTDPGVSTPVASPSHTFKVVEVAPDSSAITVKVDGELYRNLKAGEVFATYFKVVLISGQVNSFQYGDEKFNVIGTKKLTIA